MLTLADISLQVAQAVASVQTGQATSSDATSITDTDGIVDPNGTWDKGSIWFLSGPLIGKVAVILTNFGNKLTFPSLGAIPSKPQIETLTVLGSVTGSGNATVIVTAAGMANSPKTLSVAVTNGDSASVVAGKVRTALNADADVIAFFTVGGAAADVILTVIKSIDNDATMNISIANGTCTGLTAVPNAANTQPGIGCKYAICASDYPYVQLVSGINAALATVQISQEDSTLIGDGITLIFTIPSSLADIYKVEIERNGDPQRRYTSAHWHELNGLLQFDNYFPPENLSKIHIFARIRHSTLVTATDQVDDEVRQDWLLLQATFNVLMWGKQQYGDDSEYDIIERLQVAHDKLDGVSKSKHTHVIVQSAGIPD